VADDLPTGDKAIFAFLEMIALAFAFEGTAELLHDGHAWHTYAGAYLGARLHFSRLASNGQRSKLRSAPNTIQK
jgi:hypothetical protein